MECPAPSLSKIRGNISPPTAARAEIRKPAATPLIMWIAVSGNESKQGKLLSAQSMPVHKAVAECAASTGINAVLFAHMAASGVCLVIGSELFPECSTSLSQPSSLFPRTKPILGRRTLGTLCFDLVVRDNILIAGWLMNDNGFQLDK